MTRRRSGDPACQNITSVFAVSCPNARGPGARLTTAAIETAKSALKILCLIGQSSPLGQGKSIKLSALPLPVEVLPGPAVFVELGVQHLQPRVLHGVVLQDHPLRVGYSGVRNLVQE